MDRDSYSNVILLSVGDVLVSLRQASSVGTRSVNNNNTPDWSQVMLSHDNDRQKELRLKALSQHRYCEKCSAERFDGLHHKNYASGDHTRMYSCRGVYILEGSESLPRYTARRDGV